jgi:hypothetical protein
MDNTENGPDYNEFATDGALRNDVAGDLNDVSPDNPTVDGLTAGGTGTAVGRHPTTGGATGSGGGVVDRVGGIATTGGGSSGSLDSGTDLPPRPETPEGAEERI